MLNLKIKLLFAVVFLTISCKKERVLDEIIKDKKPTTIKLSNRRSNLNISILLDLSDRINPKKYPNAAMEYHLRDIGYLNAIVESFEIHVRNKRNIDINDRIQLFLDPEPSDKDLNEKIKKLKISFDRNNAMKESILKTSNIYDSISRDIYKSALRDNNFIGSDIWRFFKDKVEDYCLKEGYRNILVILTDGYIYHKNTLIKLNNRTSYLTPEHIRSSKLNNSGWLKRIKDENYGFILGTDKLSELEVLILGINPDQKNPFEQDIIVEYWKDWLNQMGIKEYSIKESDLPSDLAFVIEDFIWNEKK